MSSASTPRQTPSLSMIRSSAKYSMKNSRVVLQRLLVQRVQDRVAGAVGRGAGALRGALAVFGGHAAERTLVDPAVLGARERHALVLEFDDGRNRFAAHVLDRVLVAQPVGSLDRVVEVIAPVVRAHVAQRGGNAALRRDGVRSGREDLGDARRRQALLREAEGRTQPGAAGADHDHVVLVFGDLVSGWSSARHSTVNKVRSVSGDVGCQRVAATRAPPGRTTSVTSTCSVTSSQRMCT